MNNFFTGFLLGILCCVFLLVIPMSSRISDSILMGRMVWENKIYSVKPIVLRNIKAETFEDLVVLKKANLSLPKEVQEELSK